MKKTNNVIALTTILLGAFSPTSTVFAEDNATTISTEQESVENHQNPPSINKQSITKESEINQINSTSDVNPVTQSTPSVGIPTTKIADQELIPDPVLREAVNTALRKDSTYSPTEADLQTIKSLSIQGLNKQVINDWSGLELLINLTQISDADAGPGISSDSDFEGLIDKINSLPHFTYLGLYSTPFNLTVLSNLTSTTIETIGVPLPNDLSSADFRFLSSIVQLPSLKTFHFKGYNAQENLSYVNGEGSDKLVNPLLPEGWSLGFTSLPQGWSYTDQSFLFNGSVQNQTTIDLETIFSGPGSEKVDFQSRFSPYHSFTTSFHFHVASLSSVTVHDSTIYTGDTWKPQDNFDSATAVDGTPRTYTDFINNGGKVDRGTLDVTKPGIYQVTYTDTWEGVSSIANITVKENKTAVNVHDSTIYVGDNWSAQDNFDSAIDKDGNPMDFSQVTVDDSKVDNSQAGIYDVTYTYDGVTGIANTA